MNQYTVEVYPAREIPEEPLVYEGVNSMSFIDNDSHGPARNFGLHTLESGHKIVFVCAPNTLAVTVERIN